MTAVPGNQPNWKSFEIEPASPSHRTVEFEQVSFTSRTIDEIVLPPAAGRLFGPFDTGACAGVVLSRTAAAEIGGMVVGRSISLPTGEWAEVIGVVVPRDDPSAARVYHYNPGDAGSEGEPPLSRRATYRIPKPPDANHTMLDVNVFAPNYFQFMGVPVVAGKTFDERHDACRVAIVNDEAAAVYFHGQAVGAAIIDADGRRSTVIGVVSSPRIRITQRSVAPAVYFPLDQDYQLRMAMIAETDGVTRNDLARLLRRIEQTPGGQEDPRRPPIVTTLDDHMSRTALAPERIAAVLMFASASIALLLGMLGLYGVMNDAARRRQREFALRIALGAPGNHITGQVMAEGFKLVALGTIAGTLVSIGVARWLAQIAPADGFSLAIWTAAPVILALLVVIVGLPPARKAFSADPLMMMRAE